MCADQMTNAIRNLATPCDHSYTISPDNIDSLTEEVQTGRDYVWNCMTLGQGAVVGGLIASGVMCGR